MDNNPISNYMEVAGARVETPCDMPDHILKDIIELAAQSSSKFDVDREGAAAAQYIKSALDVKHEPHWHVVIGNGFGSYVIHESQRYVYFHLNKRAFMIYKT
jgi:dynein light chain LC8-type